MSTTIDPDALSDLPIALTSAPRARRRRKKATSPIGVAFHMVDLASDFGGRVPIDRRWQVAQAIVLGSASYHFFRSVVDADVRLAIRYLRRIAKKRSSIRGRLANLDRAAKLRYGADRLARTIVEARLLARQSIEDTATACKLPVETVRLYASLFFDVEDKLDASHYIIQEAIGSAYYVGVTADDVDVIIKGCAYRHGPMMLDCMLPYFTTPWKVPDRIDTLTTAELEQLTNRVTTQVGIVAMTMDTHHAHMAFLRDHAGLPGDVWMRLADDLQSLLDTAKEKDAAQSRTIEAVATLSPASLDRIVDSYRHARTIAAWQAEADEATQVAG